MNTQPQSRAHRCCVWHHARWNALCVSMLPARPCSCTTAVLIKLAARVAPRKCFACPNPMAAQCAAVPSSALLLRHRCARSGSLVRSVASCAAPPLRTHCSCTAMMAVVAPAWRVLAVLLLVSIRVDVQAAIVAWMLLCNFLMTWREPSVAQLETQNFTSLCHVLIYIYSRDIET